MRLGAKLGFSHQLIEDDRFFGDTITLDGHKLVNFGLCSYLGLADDPRLVEAAIGALNRYGSAYSSSIAYTALPMYGELKERLAVMVAAPVVIAGTTTLAHMAALPILIRPDDLVLIDSFAHASLDFVLPTLRAKGAEVQRVPHNDLARVADLTESTHRRVWYLIDGLYSMHGDTALAEDLRDLMDSERRLWVYCDDAHGFGWAGVRGEGQHLARTGWHERLVMSFGLSKSFGALGGVVAAQDPDLIETIGITGGPLVFGGPLPPASLAAGIASADIHLSTELAVLQADLDERIEVVNDLGAALGLPLASFEHTPMWFLELGQTMTTASVVATMITRGFYVNAAVHPVVRRGKAGVRFTVTRYTSLSQIADMIHTLYAAWLSHGDGDGVVDLTALEDH